MRYDLLFQPRIAKTRYDATPLEAVLDARGLVKREDGWREWKLQNGTVEIGPLMEEGVLIATQVRVPLSEKTDLVREVVREGVGLAEAAQLAFVDPQLGTTLQLSSEPNVADQFLNTARYAGEYMGVSEAVGASFSAEEPQMSVSTRLLLAFIVFCVMAAVAFKAFL